MKYTSCFIGVPLPSELEGQFSNLSMSLKKVLPSIRLADVSTPHITIYYLDGQSQNKLDEIAERLRGIKDSLSDIHVSVGSMGLFSPESPRVLYLDVEYGSRLAIFNKQTSEMLRDFSAPDNDLGFKPHITLGRFSSDARNEMVAHRNAVAELLGKVNWNFTIDKVCIYGVDSRVQPEKQKRLIDISL